MVLQSSGYGVTSASALSVSSYSLGTCENFLFANFKFPREMMYT
jgi:hypothetical protein